MAIRLEDQELLDVFDSEHDDEFNALNEEELGWLKQLVKARDSGSVLAKHRWEQAKSRKATLDTATATNEYPSPLGNIPYWGMRQPLSADIMPTATPVTANEAPPLERGLKNTGIGLINFVPGTINFASNALFNTKEAAQGLLQAGKAIGKAGLWAAVASQNPQASEALKAKGISPDEFNEMFLNDPVMTSLMVIGGVKGLVGGATKLPGLVERGATALDKKLGISTAPVEVPALGSAEMRAEYAAKYPKGYIEDPTQLEGYAEQKAKLQESLAPVKPAEALTPSQMKAQTKKLLEPVTPKEMKAQVEKQARLPIPDPPSAVSGLSDPADAAIVNGGTLENLLGALGDKQMAEFAQANDFAVGWLDWVKDRLNPKSSRSFTATHGGTLPEFFKVADTHPDLFAAYVKKMGAKNDVKTAVTEKIDYGMYKILTNKRDQALFGKYLVAENAAALPDGTPVKGVKLTQLEMRRFASPEFQAAFKYFDENIKTELLTWKDPAGIESFRVTPNDRYMKFMPVSETKSLPKGTWVVDAEGNMFQWTKADTLKHKSAARSLGQTRKVKATAARQATGAGEYWVVDPKLVFENALSDRLTTARNNQMVDLVKTYEVTPEEAKAGVTAEGEPVIRVMVLEKSVAVPKTVADVYNVSNVTSMGVDNPGISAANKVQVSLVLLSPAEAAMHSVNVLAALYRQPGVGGKYGLIGRLIANQPFIVNRFIMATMEIADQHGAKLAANIRRISENGGTRASMFGGEETGLQSIWGFKQVKSSVFDYPTLMRRSLWGLETRARSAMLELLDRSPDTASLSDAKKVAIINNEFATYVRELQPVLVRNMRTSIGLWDAFASAGISLTKGSFKSLVGKSGRPYKPGNVAEVTWAQWGPIITMPIILNKLFDPEHRWPWQIPGLKYGDIRIYKTDKATVDVPLRQYHPAAARGMAVLGGQKTLDDIAKGRAAPQTILDNAWKGLANTGLARFGPLGRTAMAAFMGKIPYLTPQGSLMEAGDKSATQQTQNQWAAAALTAIPMKEVLTGAANKLSNVVGDDDLFLSESLAENLSPTMRRIYTSLATIGERFKIGPNEDILKAYDTAPPDAAAILETIKDIQKKARKITDPQARQEYINKRVARDLPKRAR
jgi:hypothetical protein